MTYQKILDLEAKEVLTPIESCIVEVANVNGLESVALDALSQYAALQQVSSAMAEALEKIEAHHIDINRQARRDIQRSRTIAMARDGLAAFRTLEEKDK